MDRRSALRLFGGAFVSACGRSSVQEQGKGTMATAETKSNGDNGGLMPSVFIAHGAPPLLDDPSWQAELAAWSKSMPTPKAILSLSAHWEAKPIAIGATKPIPLVYDFYGFPERYYSLKYPSPGAPELAARVRDLLRGKDIAFVDDEGRGLDHGTYVPLMSMYPKADVPVLQVSLPGLSTQEMLAFGRALAPLREEGVLIAGSGFLTHNMRAFGLPTTPAWASEFDRWCAETITKRDIDALVDFVKRAPGARLAHPREEHFVPVIATLAASLDRGGDVKFPISGFWNIGPAFTRRTVQIG